MTVCIAAVFEDSNRIIAVTDSRISSDEQSAEGVAKLFFLPRKRWAVMFAGDVRSATSLVERIRADMPREHDLNVDAFIQICETAYRTELLKGVETEILLPFGMSRHEFLTTGRQCFGDQRFDNLVERISQASLGVELLCAGFDDRGYPHLLEVTAAGAIVRCSHLPFHAIGSGALMALTSLYPLRIASETYEALIYRCCAAKFAAESSPGVGRETTVYTFGPQSDSIRHVMSGRLDPLRDVWMSLGQPPVPTEALAVVATGLKTAEQNHHASVRARPMLEQQWKEMQRRRGRIDSDDA